MEGDDQEVADLKAIIHDLRTQLALAEKRLRVLEGKCTEDSSDMHYELSDLLWTMIGQ
jgi:hypothetical protein